jgi:hypothetical protein
MNFPGNGYLDGIGLAPREDYSVRRSLVEVGAIDAPIIEFFSSIRRHARRSGSAQGWVCLNQRHVSRLASDVFGNKHGSSLELIAES